MANLTKDDIRMEKGLIASIDENMKSVASILLRKENEKEKYLLTKLYNLKDLVILNYRTYKLDRDIIRKSISMVLTKSNALSSEIKSGIANEIDQLVAFRVKTFEKQAGYNQAVYEGSQRAIDIEELKADLKELVLNATTNYDYINRYGSKIYGVSMNQYTTDYSNKDSNGKAAFTTDIDAFASFSKKNKDKSSKVKITIKQPNGLTLDIEIKDDQIKLDGVAFGREISQVFKPTQNSISHSVAASLRPTPKALPASGTTATAKANTTPAVEQKHPEKQAESVVATATAGSHQTQARPAPETAQELIQAVSTPSPTPTPVEEDPTPEYVSDDEVYEAADEDIEQVDIDDDDLTNNQTN